MLKTDMHELEVMASKVTKDVVSVIEARMESSDIAFHSCKVGEDEIHFIESIIETTLRIGRIAPLPAVLPVDNAPFTIQGPADH
ncbi:hypothetical protein [Paraburkholderia sacchari]|uniref:hypothetical protein n=1 Tax=Paraburkholderia sacchari TaxID=159450 RepID=UPI000541D06E|nr:hypothetical protein [Paraburkholderia sacchari]NLP64298.1 hypothetical protein [Paraburkholderia sacchari]